MRAKPLTAIDLFCGCGGFSLGFIQAGIRVVAAIDHEIMALSTYYTNLGDENTKIIGDIPRKYVNSFQKPTGWRTKEPPGTLVGPVKAIFFKDIQDITGWDLLNAAGVETVDIVIGSPPCQSFSTCNTKKKENDCRDYLMFEYARMVLEINPTTFMLENVPGVEKAKLPDGRNLVEVFMEITKDYNWELYYEIQALYPDQGVICKDQPKKQCNLIDF